MFVELAAVSQARHRVGQFADLDAKSTSVDSSQALPRKLLIRSIRVESLDI
jgi:hypothetical protein